MALSLTRKKNQSFTLVFDHREVKIEIAEIHQSKVMLRIQASPEVQVFRTEVLDEVKEYEAREFGEMANDKLSDDDVLSILTHKFKKPS
jgi:sRNA-binding carbon storage regulator CsrA